MILTCSLERISSTCCIRRKHSGQGKVPNKLEEKPPPVQIIHVPMVLAQDGTRISTTRIKNSEIDAEGNLN